MKPVKDMTNMKFGSWTVIKRGPNTKQGQARWICKCSLCFEFKIVKGSHLREGRSTKCKDCHNRTFNRRHGQYQKSIYKIWEAMIQRCHNPKAAFYKNYGGRGIKVCEGWKKDFLNFWADMGNIPPNLALERIDNDGNYCKANCRWATRGEQLSNTRRSHRPGAVYDAWELIENIPKTKKARFKCIKCSREWVSDTQYVTSKRAASCKCSR